MLTKYTDGYVGCLIIEVVAHIVPALVATYTAGYVFGQLVHRLNDRFTALFA